MPSNHGQKSPASPVRAQVLAAALRLYSGKGYFKTSIQDIQQAANVSMGSIYNHFSGKEAIARFLYDDLLEQMEALVDAATTQHRSAHDRGHAVVDAMFRLAESDPEMIGFILNARHREFLVDEPGICSSRPFRKMRDIVVDGMDAGEIRPMDPWIASSLAFGPALRMISLRLDGMIERPLTDSAQQVWAATWDALGARPLAAP